MNQKNPANPANQANQPNQPNPQTYISEVGLYDTAGDLIAIGRLSSPINKNFSSEAIVKVRLTY